MDDLHANSVPAPDATQAPILSPILMPPTSSPTSTSAPVSYRYTAGLLAIFLGSLGVHNFYLGKRNLAITQLLLTTVGSIFTLGLSSVAVWIWSLVEGIMILSGSTLEDGRGQTIIDSKPPQANQKSQTIAGFLALFLGVWGVHNFYLGNTTKAVIQVLLGTVGACFIVGPLISMIWGILDGVQIFNGQIRVDANNLTLYHPAQDESVRKSKTAAICLAFTFGVFGVHDFYLGNTSQGAIKLLLATVGACFVVGPFVALVLAYLDGIKLAEEDITSDALGLLLAKD